MIKTLDTTFQANYNGTGTSTFTQIKRNDKVAIYVRQWEDGHKVWEVFTIKTLKAGAQIFNQTLSEDTEMYPGTSAFGRSAWSCNSLERAEYRFDVLTNGETAEEAVEEVEEASEVKVETPGRRGRPSVTRSALVIPVGNFCMQDVVNKNPEYTKPVCYIELQKLIKQNKVEVIGNKDNASGRGKKIVIYQAVEA